MMNAQIAADIPSVLSDRSAVILRDFGCGSYGEVLQRQDSIREDRQADRIPDTWLVGEHPLVITQGVRGIGEDVRNSQGTSAAIFSVDRGGMTTLHNPGQLIVYPIVRVEGGSMAAGRFSRALLAAMRQWIEHEFGLLASVRRGHPGLYVEGRKLLSIGISVRGGVSMHGVALNMCNDLSDWSSIVACGEAEARPVSLSEVLDRRVQPADQVQSIGRWLAETWGYRDVRIP